MSAPFVVNVADASAFEHPAAGIAVVFEDPDRPWPELGLNIRVLQPGQTNAYYHAENQQEDFLVLGGSCVLILDGTERELRAWDLVHCPPGSRHAFVGAGEGPCWILMIGARRPDEELEYPVDHTAAKHGASVAKATRDPEEAYAGRPGSWAPTRPPWPPAGE